MNEPRITRIVEARGMIDDLAYKLNGIFDTKPKKVFNEFTGKWEIVYHNFDNPDYDVLEKITGFLYSACDYIDDEVLPTVQDRIEEEALSAVV